MRRASFAAALLLVAGCSSAAPTPAPAPTPVKTPNVPAASPAELRTRAAARMQQGEYAEAAEALAALAKGTATADDLNDLAFAYLNLKNWQAALTAGEQALALNERHPYALYNTGVAALELGKPCRAAELLNQSANRQEKRPEPQVALARAYMAAGSYARARYAAAKALALAPADPEAKAVSARVEAMLTRPVPADKPARISDDAGMAYVLPEEPATACSLVPMGSTWSAFRFVFTGPTGAKLQVPFIGTADSVRRAPYAAQSPAYLVGGGPIGAGVARSDEWRLFVAAGGRLQQILFPENQGFMTGPLPDFVRSQGSPMMLGDYLLAGHPDDATGQHMEMDVWKIDAVGGIAKGVGGSRRPRNGEPFELEGTVVALGDGVLLQTAQNLEGWALSPSLQGSLSGRLKVGQKVRMKVESFRITRVDVLNQ